MSHYPESPESKRPQRLPLDENWERQTLRDVLMEAYREQKRNRIWKAIWRGVYLLVFLSFMAGIMHGGRNSDSNKNSLAQMRGEHTAVIELSGEIGGDKYTDHVQILRDGMEAAYNNKNAKAIVILANSPGGSPVVSNIAFQEILRLKKQHTNIPVYLVAQDLCASGCYYIAAAADKIYADPSSIVGSIGVIGSSFDATALMEKIGIKRRQRTAGSNKGMGDPFSSETPEQQAIWQNMLNQIHTEFIKAVKQGRGERLKFNQHPDVFSGRVYTGAEAKEVGLIDDLGNVYSVARDVVKAPDLVDYTPREDDFSRLLSRSLGAEVKSQVESWTQKIW
ncbi:S49 family peptidase [Alysiella filiformis]|uniref:Protease-4 n=1 Tax=Alysiella filiformis DSM 16848 TaxID=1120981 RepID=A0A286EEH3_9NEIS|nr:S49 family peptidase [Alysiella filiformis]QMT31633.1 S49 family peptidase [Alysiella filiformis]UBQ55356.1 S49 family peptidase [Alysiella filiformis DSM 16848]SOD69305.1 protease-4 [Alysiella filiformis DSM 16848]